MGTNQRHDPRVAHEKRVLLKFSPTLGFVGTTTDISLGGAFVRIPHPPHDVTVGHQGTFHLMSDRQKYQYRFKVVRINGLGLGVHFLDTPDDFVVRMLRED